MSALGDSLGDCASERSCGYDGEGAGVPGQPAAARRAFAPGAGQPAHAPGRYEVRRSELLRAVNEAIRSVSFFVEGPVGFHCECGADGCSDIVELDPSTYDTLRESPGVVLLASGHEAAEGPDA